MFTEYTGNRQFDLQLNRYLGPILDRPGMDPLTTSTLARIRSTSQITQFAGRMAARFDAEGDAAAAWRLYCLAAFYLPEHDQRKRHFIDAAQMSVTLTCAYGLAWHAFTRPERIARRVFRIRRSRLFSASRPCLSALRRNMFLRSFFHYR